MDFFLFVLLLVGFAALYVALQIYLLYTLIILLIIAIFYVVIKYPRGKEDWPFGFTDNIYTVCMSNIIIVVFVIVVPTISFVGSQPTYVPQPVPPDGWELVFSSRDPWVVLWVLLIHAIVYFLAFALLIPYMQRQASSVGGSMGEHDKESSKPKIGIG